MEKKIALFLGLGLIVVLVGSILAISGGITGNVIRKSGFYDSSITGQVVSEVKRIPQEYTLKFTIKPGALGIIDSVYVYDDSGILKQEVDLHCANDLCYDEVDAEVYIDDTYLGDYYILITKPNSTSVLRQDFYVYESVVDSGVSSEEDSNEIIERVEQDCISDFNCGNWSECEVDYNLDDLLNGVENIKGTKTRTCEDRNDCVGDRIEIRECVATIPVYAKKIEWCQESYIELYERDTDKLISRIKDNRDSSLPSLDIAFVYEKGVCRYCSNGVKDGDETGVDCGGSCPECVDEEYDTNFFQKMMWQLDFD